MRPYIGIVSRSTFSIRPGRSNCVSELMPRSDRARLIDLVKFNGTVAGSRRSTEHKTLFFDSRRISPFATGVQRDSQRCRIAVRDPARLTDFARFKGQYWQISFVACRHMYCSGCSFLLLVLSLFLAWWFREKQKSRRTSTQFVYFDLVTAGGSVQRCQGPDGPRTHHDDLLLGRSGCHAAADNGNVATLKSSRINSRLREISAGGETILRDRPGADCTRPFSPDLPDWDILACHVPHRHASFLETEEPSKVWK